MLLTREEVLQDLGESETAYVSEEFWLLVHDRLDPGKSSLPETYNQLLAFQTAWVACKKYYGINT